MNKTFIWFPVLIVFALASIHADDAVSLLQSMDERMVGKEAPSDIEAAMIMTIKRGSMEKKRELRIWNRNFADKDTQRLLKFVAPPDVRDMGMLVLNENTIYVYLPEFHRTRRIAASGKGEAFMGSDFSYGDMGNSRFSPHYDPKLLRENEKEWVLELNRRSGSDRPYSRVVLAIDKQSRMMRWVEDYDNKGALWKKAEQTSVQVGGFWVIGTIRMTDVKKGSTSTLEMKDIRVNQNPGDEIFSERFLARRIR